MTTCSGSAPERPKLSDRKEICMKKKSLLNHIILVAVVYTVIWLLISVGIMTYTFRSLAVIILAVSVLIARLVIWLRKIRG